MRTITVVQTNDLLALVNRITHNGTVELDQFFSGFSRLDHTQVEEQTLFDVADNEFGVGQSHWPPAGRWQSNEQGKDAQEAHVDL